MIRSVQGSGPVLAVLEALLAEEGSVPFETVMELALYHPEGGFYRTGCPPRGRARGHYATCAHIDPALGLAVARWLVEARREVLGSPLRWHVVEVGGGDGTLAEAVLSALPLRLRPGLVYHSVEVSEPARALQRERLGIRLRPEPSMEAALDACDGRALVFSNELVDAFPAVALERRDGRWLEIRLATGAGGRLVEELADLGPWAEEDGPLSVLSLSELPDGARAEAQPSVHRWLRGWVPSLRRGAVLTIDYGDRCEALYGRGGGGTLRGYLRNQRVDGPGELADRLGLQDLTCDVSFTDLEAWGEGLGLRAVGLLTQRELLERFGALDARRPTAGLAFVSDPAGAGGHYRALVQERR